MKQCANCKQTKALTEFYKDKRNKSGFNSYCKECAKTIASAWHFANPERKASSILMRIYGITLEQKIEMLTKQNSCCAMCGNSILNVSEAHMDHCHTSKTLRDILCRNCNLGIGYFKDSIEKLKLGILYLEKHAKQKSTSPIPTRPDRKSKDDPQLGTIPTTGAGQNGDDTDHHSGTVQRQDVDHSTQASSPDGMGHRDKQVATSQQPNLLEDIRQ